jgi:thymidylate synthase
MKTFENFSEAYVDVLADVFNEPEYECSPRGMKIKERLGYSFRVSNVRDRIPFLLHRDFGIAYYVAESLWYLSGNNSTDWISYYSGFWKDISDDGVTANSAYGARIFMPHERVAQNIDPTWTQWQYVKEELERDPDSRRAVIHIRSAQDSLLARKDVPCTLALQFFIRDSKLHLVASMRSNDAIFGLSYDVPAFTTFQELMANEMQIECGSYTHVAHSMHIYERHYKMVQDILDNDAGVHTFPMPKMPTPPPIKELMAAETTIRHQGTPDTLLTVVEAAASSMRTNYYADWVFILGAHKARKLKCPELYDVLMRSVNFEGYKCFNK